MDTLNLNQAILDVEELKFAMLKHTARNQLAFATMLKFFQAQGYYPTNTDVIPETLIVTLAHQLNVDVNCIDNYNWDSRSVKRFRQDIRHITGYKEASETDGERLIAWLIKNASPESPTLPNYREKAYHFFREQKLEPCKSQQLDRYIRSANHRFEKQFFLNTYAQLSSETLQSIDDLLQENEEDNCLSQDSATHSNDIKQRDLKKDIAGAKLKNVQFEITKLNRLRSIKIPNSLFETASRKLIQKYYTRILAEFPGSIKRHDEETRYTTMVAFCYLRSQVLTDNLTELFIQLIHKMNTSSEAFITKEMVLEIKRVNGKFDILHTLADTAANHPNSTIQDKIYPKVSQETLRNLAAELHHTGKWYQSKVQTKMCSFYSHGSRKMLLALLNTFIFHTNNAEAEALLKAVEYIKQHQNQSGEYYPDIKVVPIDGVINSAWRSAVIEGQHVNRMNYEIAVLEALRTQLRCKNIWIEGAYRYRNPDEDLPKDFDDEKEYYYKMLDLPPNADEFIASLKAELEKHLQELNDSVSNNDAVKVLTTKDGGKIKLSPSTAQPEPVNLKLLQQEISRRWSTINLIDVLKETDLRIHITQYFNTVASRENIDKTELQKRLLLCLYGIGSNIGLKRMSAANDDVSYSDLRYIKRRYVNSANVKAAIIEVVNNILEIRDPRIWGQATTGVACDSTQVSSWDQNLITEWHIRYRGRGVMIYWHVDKNSAVIHSQLKTCSSSEVASMIQGILKHCTKMDIKQSYVDTHGQSTVGFGFSHLLHFDLLPRLKNLNRQKLYYANAKHKDHYQNLTAILKSAINWGLIKEHYNEVVKHVAALKTGMVEPDVLIKRFSRDNYNHPVYKALSEIGNAVKTIFLSRYLSSESLRIEIHEALNVVERLNGIMTFIFYGKLSEISTNNRDDQELSVACLHLLQVCMVYINTLIIQEILSDPLWKTKLTLEDWRALTPLIHAHLNPYGLFPLDFTQRLAIKAAVQEPEKMAA